MIGIRNELEVSRFMTVMAHSAVGVRTEIVFDILTSCGVVGFGLFHRDFVVGLSEADAAAEDGDIGILGIGDRAVIRR